jgi:hypothetical protein
VARSQRAVTCGVVQFGDGDHRRSHTAVPGDKAGAVMIEEILREAGEHLDGVLEVAERGLAALLPEPPASDLADSVIRRRQLLDMARQRSELAAAALRAIRRDAETRIDKLVEAATVDLAEAARAGHDLSEAVARRLASLQDALGRTTEGLSEM